MAYGARYQTTWKSPSKTGTITFYQNDYTGYAETITVKKLKINTRFTGWGSPIVQTNCSFTVINDKDDYYELFDLLELSEKEWKVIVWNSTDNIKLFEGFINSETTSHDYLELSEINITCSQYISRLDGIYVSSIESTEPVVLSKLIFDSLKKTGLEFPAYINNALYPSGTTSATTESTFSLCGVTPEIFWKNNIERDSAKKIIEKILIPFDTYLYYYDGKWYLERYQDIWNTGKTLRVYADLDNSTGCTTATETRVIREVISDTATFKTIGTPEFEIEQGLYKISVNLNQSKYFNLTNPSFAGATGTYGVVPYPVYRTWNYYTGGVSYTNIDQTYGKIAHSIYRVGWEGVYNEHRGIYTRFACTIDATSTIECKWKWHGSQGSMGAGDPEGYKLRFYYYLRNPLGNWFIMYDAENDVWVKSGATEENAVQYVEIDQPSLDKSNASMYYYEPSFTIPIGEVQGITLGDNQFVLCIGLDESLRGDGYNWTPLYSSYIGDVEITASGSWDDNLIEAEVSNTFLGEDSTDLYLFDTTNLSLKNGLLKREVFTDTVDGRIAGWTDDGLVWWNIWEHLLAARFRLYKSNVYNLSIEFLTSENLKMFDLFQDTSNTRFSAKKFVLMKYDYDVENDIYKCELSQYDNSEDITFI